MLCPRALSASPRSCLVRQICATKPRLPVDYPSALRSSAACPQPVSIQQQSRCFKKRAFRPKVQGVVVTTATGEAERAGANFYDARRGAQGRDQDKSNKKGDTTLRDKNLLAHPLIHLKNVEKQTISEPVNTHDVLAEMDLETETLVCMFLPSKAKQKADADADADVDIEVDEEAAAAASQAASRRPQFPVCAIMNRAKYDEHLEKERILQRLRELGTKELEINWTIDKHDLGHKLRRLREFLGKGYTVQVTFLKKRQKKRSAAKDEDDQSAAETLRLVKETVAEVPGAKESKKPDGRIGHTLTLTFDAPGIKSRRLAALAEATADPEGSAQDPAGSESPAEVPPSAESSEASST